MSASPEGYDDLHRGTVDETETLRDGLEDQLLWDILDQMKVIARLLPPQEQLMPKKEALPGIGILHWQRIGDIVALTATHKPEPSDHQAIELKCQLVYDETMADYELDEAEGEQKDIMFSISLPSQTRDDYMVFEVVEDSSGFKTESDKNQRLTFTELQLCNQFARDIAGQFLRGPIAT